MTYFLVIGVVLDIYCENSEPTWWKLVALGVLCVVAAFEYVGNRRSRKADPTPAQPVMPVQSPAPRVVSQQEAAVIDARSRCHDARCPACLVKKHKCHNLDCKEHYPKATA